MKDCNAETMDWKERCVHVCKKKTHKGLHICRCGFKWVAKKGKV